MRPRSYAVIALFLLPRLATPGDVEEAKRTPALNPSGTVTVAAAASLTSAFQMMADAFEKAYPGATVQLNFAGSSTLVQQIQQGAPVDVFASADEGNMQKLVASGAIAGAPQLFARNALQIVVPPGNPKHVRALADLAARELAIVLCGPTVPCGRYAAEAFAKAGVAAPAASQELNVKAVLTKVGMGEADAGIVYVTDVRAAAGTVAGVDIPESSNVIARYPIAVVKHAPNAVAAAAFVELVLSSEGQRLLATFGFLPR